ncbi:hypothetical protein EfmAA55_02280 [Enterococcus faecium]|nr:hypothetical protein EfmAA55_02280 [Enterococcus faecium]
MHTKGFTTNFFTAIALSQDSLAGLIVNQEQALVIAQALGLQIKELKSIFKASELELTRERKEHFLEKYGCDSKLSAACDILENGFEDAIQILSFPENIRRRIRTTNVLERLNEEIRRRERVIRIFPNINSITRIIGTLLMEKDTEWLASPRKYLEFNSNNI